MSKSKKWKSSYDDNRKYNEEWEKIYPWVRRAPDGSDTAFCRLCNSSIAPRAGNLGNHEKTEKHKAKVAPKHQKPLMVTKTVRDIKKT